MTRAAPLLFRRLPGLASLPWIPLADLPTPIAPCDAIAPWLGRSGVFMKRDDLASKTYGGNKVRRYELVLADAKAKRAKRIVTVGGIASTQVMATAIFGQKLGFDVEAILFDQPLTAFAREAVLVDVDAGARLSYGGGYVRTAWRAWRAMKREPGAYFIMPGAANALANLGYVDAIYELEDQVARGEAPKPDAIVLPTGSSGTLAALAIGLAAIGWDTEVIGVRITARIACNRFTIGRVIASTERFIAAREPSFRARPVRYSLFHDAIGPGYGHPTPAAIEGASQVRALTGATGEITYSGKALAALKVIARDPRWAKKTILLWNTLSTPRPTPSPDARARVPAELEWIFERALVA